MNILYINHYAGSIYHGMEFRPYYLAREWVKLGHNVSIIASSFSHLRSKNIFLENNFEEESIDGIKYIWCKTISYNSNGLKRIINIHQFLRRVNKLIPYIVTELKPDLVISSSTYPFDTKIAYKISKLTNAKFIYEVHDLWPLTLIELNGISKYNPYIMYMQKAENFGYRHADFVVSLLPLAKEYMELHGLGKNKFKWISNGVCCEEQINNFELLSEQMQNNIEQIKKNYKFLIAYCGTIGKANALEYLIKAAREIPKFAILIVGDGMLKQKLINQSVDYGLTNVYFLGKINKNQVLTFLKQMDCLYLGWCKSSLYRFGISPNKVFDYMLSGRPILHSVDNTNDIVKEAKCGISVVSENPQVIVDGLKTIANMSKKERDILGLNGKNFVTTKFDYQLLAKKFLEILDIDRSNNEN